MRVKHGLVGKVIRSNNYGYFKVLSQHSNKSDIVFINTGFKKTVSSKAARLGQVKDPLVPTAYGVGYIGDGEFKSTVKGKMTIEYSRWKLMMHRCYSGEYQARNKTYAGCKVCDEWHNFQSFAKWFNDNYPKGGRCYHLDKDLKAGGRGKMYSPELCVFISGEENNEIAHAKRYCFKNPNGEFVEVFNLRKFCRDNDLYQSCMHLVSLGVRKTHKKWTSGIA